MTRLSSPECRSRLAVTRLSVPAVPLGSLLEGLHNQQRGSVVRSKASSKTIFLCSCRKLPSVNTVKQLVLLRRCSKGWSQGSRFLPFFWMAFVAAAVSTTTPARQVSVGFSCSLR